MQTIELSTAHEQTRISRRLERNDTDQYSLQKYQEQGRHFYVEAAKRIVSALHVLPSFGSKSPQYYELKEILQWAIGFHLHSKAQRHINCPADMKDLLSSFGPRSTIACPMTWDLLQKELPFIETGGSFICQVDSIFKLEKMVILWVMFKVFDRVFILRPASSHVLSTHIWVLGLRCRPVVFTEEVKGRSSRASIASCPVSWFSYIAEISDTFDTQRSVWRHRVSEVTSALIRQHPFMTQDQLEKVVDLCSSASSTENYCRKHLMTAATFSPTAPGGGS